MTFEKMSRILHVDLLSLFIFFSNLKKPGKRSTHRFKIKIIKNPQQYRITVESTNKESTDLSRFRLLTIFILAMGLISQVHYFLDKDG